MYTENVVWPEALLHTGAEPRADAEPAVDDGPATADSSQMTAVTASRAAATIDEHLTAFIDESSGPPAETVADDAATTAAGDDPVQSQAPWRSGVSLIADDTQEFGESGSDLAVPARDVQEAALPTPALEATKADDRFDSIV